MSDDEQRMQNLVSLAKRRGFIFPGSEIYGGYANTWDYGPYGVQLRKNIRDAWWQRFVTGRLDVVGVETPVIMSPKVWEASGHVGGFSDPMVDCKKCKNRFRADHLLEENGGAMPTACPECRGELTEVRQFNLMFKTNVGPMDDDLASAYLRPETAQGMFTAWKNVRDAMRVRLPYGIAQIGKAFRNEITTGNFIFRTREFEQMEIEYFVHPDHADEAFEMWLLEMKSWVRDVLKLPEESVVYQEIGEGDRAHYSSRTIDVEYKYPFGQKELYGLANRSDYDLKKHQEVSGEDLTWRDPHTGEKVLPYVIEPTWGLDRTVLAVLLAHMDEDAAPTSEKDKTESRVVLRLPKNLAPVKVAVFPLQKKEDLQTKAKELISALQAYGMAVEYDESGSIGKRYRRQDEIGTPWCVTLDMDSIEDGSATIRDRDTLEQERVVISDIPKTLFEQLHSNS
ncbi:MAG: glycine--tRNA ligase [bacterium]|nr:glycine--tRNA ligase [bacterium]